MERGYVQVYTGNGKGKTTAAIGLMLRAASAGQKIYFGQFMKEGARSEIKMLRERFPEITAEQFGGGFVMQRPTDEQDILDAQRGLARAREALFSGVFDMVVLDEINVAVFLETIALDDVLQMMQEKPLHVELVLTGRYANAKIKEAADLVSDIVQVKHYFNSGVKARMGIEM